ncbi:putative zinc finger protein [Orchesella cincta]|uniref:Putative zinc finger protein n=1 Tax=Orchesella cincta TaxID=48709 RepID=A0A1D2N8W4_ORCCI|nr:putative zinc finger protein [Orchesella cincta]
MDPSHVGYGQATPNANFQQVHQGIPPPSTEPVYCPATIASNAYPPVVPGQFSSSQQNQYQQHGTTAVAVTVMNVEQCCVCSNFYEQQSRHIPQPDLNRMICKLLDVAPQENSFFREYLAVCINCTNLLRKFDRLRVELEFVKTQVVTYVIETFTQIRPEGGTPMDTLRNQILNRWTNVGGTGKKRKEGYSAADKTSNPSNELSFAALNNIIKNPTVVEPAESWNVGTEVTVRSNAASTSTPAKEVSSHSTPEDAGNDDPDYDDGDFGNDDHHSYANDDSNDEGEGTEVKDAVANIPKATNIRPRSSASPKRRKNKQVGGVKPKRVRKLQPYKPLPNEVAPLICTLCGRMYDRMCNYNAHTQACYGDDSVMEKNCYICSEQKNEPCMFDTWDDYKTHIYAYHPVVKLERCSFCRSRFLPNGVKRHKCFAYKHQVNKDAIFKCDRCDRAYNSRSNLTDHVRRIHKDEQHTCDICQKSYGSPMLLNLHVERHRLIVSKFQCTECGVCLSSSFSLKEHLKRHKGTPQFECEICGRKFYQRSTFKNHALVHSDLKPHVCHLCGTKFKLKSTLRRHIVRHEVKETNYTKKCPLCPKAMFRKVWVLKRHMNVEHPFTQEREDILEKYKDVDDFPHRNKAANAKRYDKAGKNRSTANARIKTEPLDSDEASASENDDDWDDKDNSDSEQPQKNMPSTSTSSPARKSARLENRGLTSKSLVVILQKDSSVDAKLNAS